MTDSFIPSSRLETRIFMLRGEKVMLDVDLAGLYDVELKALNQAVKRNAERFPGDFVFQLSEPEVIALLRSQIVTAETADRLKPLVRKDVLRSQAVTAKDFSPGKGGRRTLPYAFTEQGIAMLSSVLRSNRAVAVNIEIMRTFVRLRQMIATSAELSRKLAALEKKYDAQFKAVFDAIRDLMSPDPVPPSREIGYHTALPALSPKKSPAKRKAVSA